MRLFKKRRNAQEQEDALAQEEDPRASVKKAFEREVAIYEGLPDPELTDDPFKWWQHHKGALPLHARLARKYLVIPASSLTSERLFSTGGNVITHKNGAHRRQRRDVNLYRSKCGGCAFVIT